MNVPHIIQAGLDDLIPVVIIITVIITRMIKLAKESGSKNLPPASSSRPSRPPIAPDTGSPVEPGEELRRFLESLSGVSQPEPAPEAPPAKAPQQPQRFKPHPVQPPRPPQPGFQRKKTRLKPAPAPSDVTPQRNEPKVSPPKPLSRPTISTTPVDQAGDIRKALEKHLANPASLRAAWVIREVLSQPVGLRDI